MKTRNTTAKFYTVFTAAILFAPFLTKGNKRTIFCKTWSYFIFQKPGVADETSQQIWNQHPKFSKDQFLKPIVEPCVD